MRIAYRGNWRVGWTTETFVARALENLGHTVVRCQEDKVDWPQVRAEALRSDVLLWQRTWDIDADEGHHTLAALSDAGVPSASLHWDLYFELDREAALVSDPFWRTDFVFTADGGHEARFAEQGINHRWLPPGVDRAFARPVRPDLRRHPHPVVFVGSHPYPHPQWEPHRTAMLAAVAARFGPRFRIWPDRGRPLRLDRLSVLYHSAKVIVGDSCLAGQVPCYWSDRLPETLARGGGALVHPEVPGMDDWYADGRDLLTFPAGDHDTLIALIERLLADDEERTMLAKQGQATVLGRDTYEHRMTQLLCEMGLACNDEEVAA